MGASEWIAVAGLVVGSGVLAFGWRKFGRVAQMAEDWNGRPERRDPMSGVVIDPGRASMPGRIAALEAQMHPNGGSSLHDQVRRMAGEIEQLRALMCERIGVSQ